MRGVDGHVIYRGDVVINIHSDKAYKVATINSEGMYFTDGRFVPWFLTDAAWRRITPKERAERLKRRYS